MATAPAQNFMQLTVWQKSHDLVLKVYKLTRTFPREELFGLTSQMRRAASSVPANIAEAFKKRSKSDKVRILNISQGSLEELRYYFILSEDLAYLEAAVASRKLLACWAAISPGSRRPTLRNEFDWDSILSSEF